MRGKLQFRRTSILMVGCGAFLAGLALARLRIGLSPTALVLPLLLLLISFRKRTVITILSVTVFALLAGVMRGQAFLINTDEYDRLDQEKVVLIVSAATDATYNERRQLSFDATSITMIEPYDSSLAGIVKVAGFGENAVYKGDRLLIEGKMYRTRGSRQASIGYAQFELIKKSSSKIDSLRRDFASGISSVLPDPQAPFGLGLLIGQRTTLGVEATAWLAAVGLTHIVAVSGYNLTIIVRFVHRLFAKNSRYQTVLFSAVIIGAFLLMTGFSASIVRASIVCGLSLLAWYYGRRIRPLLLLLLTACITAGWYPVYLWADIGWYLSFLAFFGVLIVAPMIISRFFNRKPKLITMAIIETFCAQLMTLPIILYIFNETSAVALISNALIVPLVPLAMLFTLIAGLAGMISPEILHIAAVPANLLLTYILSIARLLSQVPYALISVSISIVIMIAAYTVLAALCLILWHITRGNRGIITDENLI